MELVGRWRAAAFLASVLLAWAIVALGPVGAVAFAAPMSFADAESDDGAASGEDAESDDGAASGDHAGSGEDTPPFPDVNPNSVHAPAITRLAELGIATGDAQGRFSPADTVTRAQTATLLVRTLDLEPAEDNRFEDVLDTNVHAAAINALVEAGVSTGVTQTTFAPNRSVTRAQLASLLTRALALSEADGLPFDDVDPEDVHAPAIAAAAAAGITTGVTATSFAPEALIRRDQLATMLARALDHLDAGDDDEVDSDAGEVDADPDEVDGDAGDADGAEDADADDAEDAGDTENAGGTEDADDAEDAGDVEDAGDTDDAGDAAAADQG